MKISKRKNRNSSAVAHQGATDFQMDVERITLGPYASYSLQTDPKHLCFTFSRYKFCAKILEGKRKVVEIGCGDGLGLPIVAQSVKRLWAVDWDSRIIDDNNRRLGYVRNCKFAAFDFIQGPFTHTVDAIYLLDVIEHLQPRREANMMRNIVKSLEPFGICIIGTPNIEASRFASPQSEVGHINLKGYKDLRTLMQRYFNNVFLFSMNDEVLHTGFYPMAHYLFALGVGPILTK